jgi:hypothetical protein
MLQTKGLNNIFETTKNNNKFQEFKHIKKKRSTLLKSEKAYQISVLKEINYSMIILGFKIENLFFLHYKFKYKTLDEAISLISKQDGFYNHDYFDISEFDDIFKHNNLRQSNLKQQVSNNENNLFYSYNSLFNSSSMLNSKYLKLKLKDKCLICNDKVQYHLNIISKNNTNTNNNNIKKSNIVSIDSQQPEDDLININQENHDNNHHNIHNIEMNSQGKLFKKNILEEFIKSKKQVNNCSFEHLKDMQYDTNKQVLAYLQQTYTHERPKERDCTICYKNQGLADFCHCDKKCCFKCLKEYFLSFLLKENSDTEQIPCLFNCGYSINEFLKSELIESLTPDDHIKLKPNKVCLHLDSNFNFNSTGIIPCVYQNCSNRVYYNELTTKFVACDAGHKFCARCKYPWHLNMECISFFNNSTFISSNLVRMCPNCGLLIMREIDNYTIKCSCCYYQFCFFCLDQVEENHFSLYNLQGCGWKKENKAKYDTVENTNVNDNKSFSKFQKCFVFLCWIFYHSFYFLFFLLFGCCYEFVTMFNEYLYSLEEKAEKNKSVLNDLNVDLDGPENYELRTKQKATQYFYYLYFLFVTIFLVSGIICQPIYIIYKLLDKLLDFIKFYGLNDSDHRD